jgi:micrococcal nuclease
MYQYHAKLIKVIDGDTVDLDVDLGFSVFIRVRFRLLGINTPEIHGVKKTSEEYAKGVLAKVKVEDWFAERDGKCLIKTADGKSFEQGKYGRWLVRIHDRENEAVTVSAMLMDQDLAVFYGQPSPWSRD